jgi:hypothetical protein
MRTLILTFMVAAIVGLAGCGGDDCHVCLSEVGGCQPTICTQVVSTSGRDGCVVNGLIHYCERTRSLCYDRAPCERLSGAVEP